jgi:hypothetical protein
VRLCGHPGVVALSDDRALPSGVLGPQLFCAFFRLASIRAALVMAGCDSSDAVLDRRAGTSAGAPALYREPSGPGLSESRDVR